MPWQITSKLVGKSYPVAGQTGMAVLQAYQADLLKDLDQGEGLSTGAVDELRIATGPPHH